MFKEIKRNLSYYRGRLIHRLPESMYLKIIYHRRTGLRLNLKNPVTFNDKLQWLKLHYRPKLLVQLADKYLAREYVAQRVGEKYLIPLLGVYDTADEIDLSVLPDQFILKPNHGSGWVIRCTDKQTFDLPAAQKNLRKWMTLDYSDESKEWHYALIPRKIICEKYISGEDDQPPDGYKFYCADGQPYFCQADKGYFAEQKFYFYDMNWQKLPISSRKPVGTGDLPRPQPWSEMLEVASKLSRGLPFCRVDLYAPRKSILFGEITLFPGGGFIVFKPDAFNVTLGDKITLPEPCNEITR